MSGAMRTRMSPALGIARAIFGYAAHVHGCRQSGFEFAAPRVRNRVCRRGPARRLLKTKLRHSDEVLEMSSYAENRLHSLISYSWGFKVTQPANTISVGLLLALARACSLS